MYFTKPRAYIFQSPGPAFSGLRTRVQRKNARNLNDSHNGAIPLLKVS